MSTAKQIVDDFDTFGVILEDNKLVDKLVQLCHQYDISSEDVAATWISYTSKTGIDVPSDEAFDQMEREYLAKKKPTQSSNILNIDTINDIMPVKDDDGEDEEDLLAAYGGTPTQQSKRTRTPEDRTSKKRHVDSARAISAQFSPATLSPMLSTPSQKYAGRTNAGVVVASYGDVEKATWTANQELHPEVTSLAMGGEVPLLDNYKYMFEKMRDVGEVLNEAISVLSEQMTELMGTEEPAHIKVASADSLCSAGRVCCDSVGHLNAASVLLEGSRECSSGAAVPLDLSALQQYSLFPGQIVGIKGINSTGNKIRVQELLPGKILPPPAEPITIDTATGPIQVAIGCGPFTTTDNMLYEPLTDLLTAVQENPPHLLILLGPILDASHPLVLNNDLTISHEAAFSRYLKIITTALEGLHTQLIVVSSSRDLCAPLVYPTPPYSVGSSSVRCVSDPALIDINGAVVALTSTDVLFHLGKEEISFPPQGSDRLGRLSRHLLLQQSMYPLYPPAEGLCVDQEQAESHARLPCTPHILVIPSDLRYFVKEVEGCMVVNPERLAKGVVGGTYARLELHPPQQNASTTMAKALIAKIVKV